MAELKLTTVTRTQGNNRALKDGTVKPRSFAFEFVEVDPLIDAFRRMVRDLEFDLSEMAMSTFITARAHGKKIAGLPIFLMRAFHHGAVRVNARAGIATPKDLEGKRVGVNRDYTVTTGVWARSVLQNEYGVDPFGLLSSLVLDSGDTWGAVASERQREDDAGAVRDGGNERSKCTGQGFVDQKRAVATAGGGGVREFASRACAD